MMPYIVELETVTKNNQGSPEFNQLCVAPFHRDETIQIAAASEQTYVAFVLDFINKGGLIHKEAIYQGEACDYQTFGFAILRLLYDGKISLGLYASINFSCALAEGAMTKSVTVHPIFTRGSNTTDVQLSREFQAAFNKRLDTIPESIRKHCPPYILENSRDDSFNEEQFWQLFLRLTKNCHLAELQFLCIKLADDFSADSDNEEIRCAYKVFVESITFAADQCLIAADDSEKPRVAYLPCLSLVPILQKLIARGVSIPGYCIGYQTRNSFLDYAKEGKRPVQLEYPGDGITLAKTLHTIEVIKYQLLGLIALHDGLVHANYRASHTQEEQSVIYGLVSLLRKHYDWNENSWRLIDFIADFTYYKVPPGVKWLTDLLGDEFKDIFRLVVHILIPAINTAYEDTILTGMQIMKLYIEDDSRPNIYTNQSHELFFLQAMLKIFNHLRVAGYYKKYKDSQPLRVAVGAHIIDKIFVAPLNGKDLKAENKRAFYLKAFSGNLRKLIKECKGDIPKITSAFKVFKDAIGFAKSRHIGVSDRVNLADMLYLQLSLLVDKANLPNWIAYAKQLVDYAYYGSRDRYYVATFKQIIDEIKALLQDDKHKLNDTLKELNDHIIHLKYQHLEVMGIRDFAGELMEPIFIAGHALELWRQPEQPVVSETKIGLQRVATYR